MNTKPLSVLALFVGTFSLHAATVSYDAELVGAFFDPAAADHVSNGALNLSSGSIAFDTDAGTFSGTVSGSGAIFDDKSDNAFAVFNFSSFNLTNGVTITVTGSNGLALISNSDFDLDSSIDFSGTNGVNGTGSGEDGTAAGNGGQLSLISRSTLTLGNSAALSVDGGNGGDATDDTLGGDGGTAGNAGRLTLGAASLSSSGTLTANGGTGGDGSVNGFGGDGNNRNGGIGGTIEIYVDGASATGSVLGGDPGNGSGSSAIAGSPGTISTFGTPSYVPEPSSALLIALGSLGFLGFRRR